MDRLLCCDYDTRRFGDSYVEDSDSLKLCTITIFTGSSSFGSYEPCIMVLLALQY